MFPHHQRRIQSCFATFSQRVKEINTIQTTIMTHIPTDRLCPPHLQASYLVINAQSKVFPLPSPCQTPAAQPRLLSLINASGRTPLKLRQKKNSPNMQWA